MSGRIKLHRKVIDNPISNNIELLWLFSYLLLKANHQQNTFFVWSQKITVVPWQFVWSQMKIADHFWLSRNKIIRYLKVLEDEKIVNIKWYTKYSLFTIVNRQSYQDTEHQIDNKWTSNEHQIDTNKKEKKEKNVNNDNKSIKEYNISIPQEINIFFEKQKENMISIASQINSKPDYIYKQAIEYEGLKKEVLAVWDPNVLCPAILEFIYNDDFRKNNIGSITKLRKKNPDGIKYWIVMLEKYKQWQSKKRSFIY